MLWQPGDGMMKPRDAGHRECVLCSQRRKGERVMNQSRGDNGGPGDRLSCVDGRSVDARQVSRTQRNFLGPGCHVCAFGSTSDG
jgi:hypothetical protein